MSNEQITKALDVAIASHTGHIDKSGQPYVKHVIRVAFCVEPNEPDYIITGLLHDTVEDTDLTLEEVYRDFGKTIGDAVDAISKREQESLEDYIARVKRNKIANAVKFADIADNQSEARIGQLDPKTAERLRRKYAYALELLGSSKP